MRGKCIAPHPNPLPKGARGKKVAHLPMCRKSVDPLDE